MSFFFPLSLSHALSISESDFTINLNGLLSGWNFQPEPNPFGFQVVGFKLTHLAKWVENFNPNPLISD